MNSILTLIANMISHVAIIGGGLPSAGFSFSPTKPTELKKYIQKKANKHLPPTV